MLPLFEITSLFVHLDHVVPLHHKCLNANEEKGKARAGKQSEVELVIANRLAGSESRLVLKPIGHYTRLHEPYFYLPGAVVTFPHCNSSSAWRGSTFTRLITSVARRRSHPPAISGG